MRAGGTVDAGRHRQFEIHDCLGRGGFGEVYRATMVSPGGLKTKVALKLLRSDVDPGGDAMLRLRDEGRLLAALRHPSILRAYDLALLDGRIGLVTEFVDGTDLHRLVGVLEPRAAITVIEAVAEALDAAWTGVGHEGGEPLRLVHRDIKPSNIRVSRHGEVKLLDFGIARSDEVDREARTGTGSTVGSLSYMAPERFSRQAPGPAADVYALGCTLYEVLVGERLHQDPVPVEMFRLAANPAAHARHIEEVMARLPETAEDVRGLLVDMTRHDPAKRPSAAEVARRSEALMDVLPGPSIKRWAKNWAWPDPERVAGSFDGRTITEGTLSRARVLEAPPPTSGSDTFALDLDDTERIEPTPVAPRPPEPTPADEPPDGNGRLAGAGVLILALLAGVAGAVWGGWVLVDVEVEPADSGSASLAASAYVWNASSEDRPVRFADQVVVLGAHGVAAVDATPVTFGEVVTPVEAGLLYRCDEICEAASFGLLKDPPSRSTPLVLPEGREEAVACVLEATVAPLGNVVHTVRSDCPDALVGEARRMAGTWSFAPRERPERGPLVVRFEPKPTDTSAAGVAPVPPVPEVVRPQPEVVAQPVVPEPAVPPAVPEPVVPPPSVAPATGVLDVETKGVDVVFVSAAGRFRGGEVPVGKYSIYVGETDTRNRVTVTADATTYVMCSPARQECWEER